MANEEITLNSIGGGVLAEVVQNELRKVAQNLYDPNTNPKTKRKLNISIVFKPDEKRSMCEIDFDVKPYLAGPEGGKAYAFIARARGSAVITLFDAESQPPLFDGEDDGLPQTDVAPLAVAKRA
jgi:hypothetical protein